MRVALLQKTTARGIWRLFDIYSPFCPLRFHGASQIETRRIHPGL